MQTDLRNEKLCGGFNTMYTTFSDDESIDMGIHTFRFTEDDIMRSELCKFIISKLRDRS
jgi:hypothetical protein